MTRNIKIINSSPTLNKRHCLFFPLILFIAWSSASAQQVDTLRLGNDVKITIDKPAFKKNNETILIFYALPNGNTTEQTMGKKMQEGDDWHYDIQHIKAQTGFIRTRLTNKNIVVAYLENSLKSWPSWKRIHPDYRQSIPFIIDTIRTLFPNAIVYLNGHSGGGSFIFGFIEANTDIPSYIQRISFLDSNYGYDSGYAGKFTKWLKRNRQNHLNIFAYNDSVALLNGKPVVSATGGTWYKSHQMMKDLWKDYPLHEIKDDSILIYTSRNKQMQVFLKTNEERKIHHTRQVELNGFIHSILCGTPLDSKGYKYFGERAYSE